MWLSTRDCQNEDECLDIYETFELLMTNSHKIKILAWSQKWERNEILYSRKSSSLFWYRHIITNDGEIKLKYTAASNCCIITVINLELFICLITFILMAELANNKCIYMYFCKIEFSNFRCVVIPTGSFTCRLHGVLFNQGPTIYIQRFYRGNAQLYLFHSTLSSYFLQTICCTILLEKWLAKSL